MRRILSLNNLIWLLLISWALWVTAKHVIGSFTDVDVVLFYCWLVFIAGISGVDLILTIRRG
jgi:hypothetical protein